MENYKQLLDRFLKTAASSFSSRGYKKRKKNYFQIKTTVGFRAIELKTVVYNYLGSSMEYAIKHDIINTPLDYATLKLLSDAWKKQINVVKQDLVDNPTYRISWNAIVGKNEHTTLNVFSDEDVDDASATWIQRYDETAKDVFDTFSDLNKVVTMIYTPNSLFYKTMNQISATVALRALVTLYVVEGKESAEQYFKQFSHLFDKSDSRYVDVILSAEYPIRSIDEL